MIPAQYAAPRCPASLKEGFSTYCPAAQRKLFNGKRVFHVLKDHPDTEFWKKSTTHTDNGFSDYLTSKMLLVKNKLMPSENGPYLIKTTHHSTDSSKRFYLDIPANEHLCMQIATQVLKLETIPNALIFFPDGKPAIIYRYPSFMSTFRSMHDFFYEASNEDPNSSKDLSTYLEAMEIIEKYTSASRVMKERFFKQVIFSWLINDTKHHLKNSGLVRTESGDHVLAPLLNVMSTGLHELGPELSAKGGLYAGDKTTREFMEHGYYTYYDFIEFGLKSGISKIRIDKILGSVTDSKNKINKLIESAFLPDEAKSTLIFNFSKRFSRIK